MPTTYKGLVVPIPTDLADGPTAFQQYTDSLPAAEAVKAVDVPAGTILSTCRTTAPAGWLLLDGSTVTGAQSLYPELWSVVPAGWQSGADLILPDARGRFVVGVHPNEAGNDAIGETGGTRSLVLVAANLPPHAHAQQGTIQSGNASARHTHGAAGGGQLVETYFGTSLQLPAGTGARGGNLTGTDTPDHHHAVTLTGNTGNGPGTSTPLNITPSFIAFNVMMRAK